MSNYPGPPGPPPGQNPYGQNPNPYQTPQTPGGYGYQPSPYGQPKSKGLAMTSMILGIISCLTWLCACLGVLTSVPALICGGIALNKINQGTADGKGMAITGLITGGIALVLSLINFILGIILQASGGFN